MTPVEEAKQRALSEINIAAGTARQKHVTVIYGQDQVYLEKASQAVDYVAGNFSEDLQKYPFIKAEAEALNKSPREVAEHILKAKSMWIGYMAVIEKERLQGKKMIQDSIDISTITKILHNTIETLKQL